MSEPGESPQIYSHLETTHFLSSQEIGQLNMEGHRDISPAIRTIDECREAMERMHEGKVGLVIGSGPNTPEWHHRGWMTLDIDASYNPTFAADANTASNVVEEKSLDFLLSEFITLHEIAGTETKVLGRAIEVEPAVGHSDLLAESNKLLKLSGRLIIRSVDMAGSEHSNLPVSEEYAQALRDHGFAPVLEIHNIEDFRDPDNRKNGVVITWYAEKVSELTQQPA
jgi:hypothetical protein